MDTKAIFAKLLEIAAQSKDPKGAVSSCLVKDGAIIASAASSDDGKEHAENILLRQPGSVPAGSTLYCTLEPCSKRSDPSMKDCVSDIISSGIREVVFGARDPKQSEQTQERLAQAGVITRQVEDTEIIKQCADAFNGSVDPSRVGVDVELKPAD